MKSFVRLRWGGMCFACVFVCERQIIVSTLLSVPVYLCMYSDCEMDNKEANSALGFPLRVGVEMRLTAIWSKHPNFYSAESNVDSWSCVRWHCAVEKKREEKCPPLGSVQTILPGGPAQPFHQAFTMFNVISSSSSSSYSYSSSFSSFFVNALHYISSQQI